ncbi:PREDICTED: cystatin-like, partial [Eurypyga helias]
IVAGINYTIKVEVGRTTCTKQPSDPQSCGFHPELQMAE